MPWQNRIAIYLFRNAAIHHEFYPFVEHLIVIAPTAVQSPRLAYHALEGHMRLAVPWMAYDTTGYNLLPRIGKFRHYGAHQVEVLLAPQGDTVEICHGVRVLPQVEVELPLVWQRQGPVAHDKSQGQYKLLFVCPYRHHALVFPWCGILWYAYVYPQGAYGACLHPHLSCRLQPVCHKEGVERFGEMRPMLGFSVFCEIRVRQYIPYEILADVLGRNHVAAILQVAHFYGQPVYILGSHQYCLGRDAFSPPCIQHDVILQPWDVTLSIADVRAAPSQTNILYVLPYFGRGWMWVVCLYVINLCM